jgi:hypothetical protein
MIGKSQNSFIILVYMRRLISNWHRREIFHSKILHKIRPKFIRNINETLVVSMF